MKPTHEKMLAEIMSYSPEKRNELLAETFKLSLDAWGGQDATARLNNKYTLEVKEKGLCEVIFETLSLVKTPLMPTEIRARIQEELDRLHEALLGVSDWIGDLAAVTGICGWLYSYCYSWETHKRLW